MSALFEQLKERKLVRWTAAYLVVAWGSFEVVQGLSETFLVLDAFERPLVILLGFGFLAALVLAWFHGEKGHQSVSWHEALTLALIAVAAVGTVVVSGDPGASVGDSAASSDPPRIRWDAGGEVRIAVARPAVDATDPGSQSLAETLEGEMVRALSEHVPGLTLATGDGTATLGTHEIASRLRVSGGRASHTISVRDIASGFVLRVFPANEANLDSLAALAMEAGNDAAIAAMHLDAGQAYNLAFASLPESPVALDFLLTGIAAFTEGRNSDAADWGLRAIEAEPEWPGAYQFSRVMLGNSGRMTEWAEIEPAYLTLGDRLTRQERLSDVRGWGDRLADRITAAEEILEMTGGGRQDAYLLARLAIQSNRLPLARRALDQTDWEAPINVGWTPLYRLNHQIYHLAGDFVAELEHARDERGRFEAMGHPSYIVFVRDEARALIGLDSIDAAQEIVTSFAEHPVPLQTQWALVFSLALEFDRHGHAEAARAAFAQLAGLVDEHPELSLDRRSQTYFYIEDYVSAEPLLKEAFERAQGPWRLQPAALLVMMYDKLGRPEDAAPYERTLQGLPERSLAAGELSSYSAGLEALMWQWPAAVAASRGDEQGTVRLLRESFRADVPFHHPIGPLFLHNRPEFTSVRGSAQFENWTRPRN